MNIYITTMANFALVNEAYDQFFTWDLKPVSVHFPLPSPNHRKELMQRVP